MWGSTFYLLAVLAPAIIRDTGWSLRWVIGGVTIGLLVAGMISPRVGRLIDRHGGRPVLAFSAAATAAAFVVLGLAPTLPVYVIAWVMMGVGMGTGLYDAAFAALGRLYGAQARSAITNLTLFGGFGSTVCWPLSAWLVESWDWRTACLVYAAIHLCLALPMHLLVFPPTAPKPEPAPQAAAAAAPVALAADERVMFWLLAGVQTIAQAIGAIMIVHLLVFLQARGASFAAAVALGTLFGPAQVAARVIERVFGHAYHPIWTMVAAAVLMAGGLGLLLLDGPALSTAVTLFGRDYLPAVAAAVVIYGAGYGVTWIARGTLPLVIFGAERYPVLMGRLALPSLIAPALSPFLGAVLLEQIGAFGTIAALLGLAVVNVGLVGALWSYCRRPVPDM
ncbi:MAG: MFS transporter [Variibacter sp.]|nr:MFS transporter [Variibacter sp.]